VGSPWAYRWLLEAPGLSAETYAGVAHSVLVSYAAAPAPLATIAMRSSFFPALFATWQIDNICPEISSDFFHLRFTEMRMIDFQINTGHRDDLEARASFSFSHIPTFAHV
jgi:hypothetical protein